MSRTGSVNAEGSDPWCFEQDAAKECRRFHDQRFEPLEGRREALAKFAERFYRERLGIAPPPATRAALAAIADPRGLAIEIAHDGQLPHLGIVRMVLKARDLAERDGRGVALYLVGNHYTAAMRPDNVRFGMPLRGESPDAVKHPPKIRIGKANAHVPFRWLPPPRHGDLEALREQVRAFVRHNLAHEKARGAALVPDARARAEERLHGIFDGLMAASAAVSSMGDWLMRVQWDLFRMMLGEGAESIVFLPMAELTDLFRDELAQIPRAAAHTPGGFWIHCPKCFRRQRLHWSPGAATAFRCQVCAYSAELTETEIWRWFAPDIVAYEAGLFRLGVDGWVAGSRASYHPEIRRVSIEVFGREPPPTFFLESVPSFRGAGDPPEGFRKTRLLRALLEAEPEAIAAALSAPWAENPVLRSDLIR